MEKIYECTEQVSRVRYILTCKKGTEVISKSTYTGKAKAFRAIDIAKYNNRGK